MAGLGVRIFPDGALHLEHESGTPVEFPGLAAGWAAGETRLLVLRWHTRAGGVITDFTVDLGEASASVVANHAPGFEDEQLLGVSSPTDLFGARARLAGFTVYRRPLFGGSSGGSVVGLGMDLGRGDELALIREGRDPVLVTGSWDLLFALPTTQREGGFGEVAEAWSHPLAADLLAGNGFFLGPGDLTFFTREAGVLIDTLTPGRQRLGTGLRLETGVPDAGITHTIALREGESFVVRALCWVLEGGSGRPRLEVHTDLGLLTFLEGSGGGGPSTPDELIFTGQLPPGTAGAELRILAVDGYGPLGCHLVEIQRNLLQNPSLESGTGSPWTPDGWRHEINPIAVQVREETLTVHSGQSALHYLADFSGTGEGGFAQLLQAPPEQLQEGYYAAGGLFQWISGQAPGVSITNGSLFSVTHPVQDGKKFSTVARQKAAGWEHVAGVGRRWRDSGLNAHNDLVRWGAPGHMRDVELLVDDAYFLPMDPVDLVLVPASIAGSHRAGWVRLDGADHLDHPLTLDRRLGTVVLDYRRGPVAGTPIAGFEATCTLLEVWGDADNFLRVVQNGGSLSLEGVVAGVGQSHPLPGASAPAIVATGHRLRLRWEDDEAILRLDDAEGIVLSLGARFERDLLHLRMGERESGVRDCDLEIRLPGPWSL